MASAAAPAHGQRFYVLALSEPGSHLAVADLPMGLREMDSVPIDRRRFAAVRGSTRARRPVVTVTQVSTTPAPSRWQGGRTCGMRWRAPAPAWWW